MHTYSLVPCHNTLKWSFIFFLSLDYTWEGLLSSSEREEEELREYNEVE